MSAAVTPVSQASYGEQARAALRHPARDLLAWLTLALGTLAILWPLGLTNRVLAGVDALTYFTPYWAYRMAELRAGLVPLWNPYLFLGVPFLANPQAAVLYPLHWPLSWLSAEQALVWSALLHAWLAAGFTYTFGRRTLHLSRLAAWLAALIFGLGGFTLARVENINQLNALAWLPALLWLYDETARAAGRRSRVRWGSALAVAIALQLLAGHTQTTFVNMVGLGLWAGWSVLAALWARRRRSGGAEAREGCGDGETRGHGDGETRRHGDGETRRHGNTETGRWGDGADVRLRDYLLPLLAIIPGLLLAAAQLLPTLELNGLGLRTGGLPYRQAVSFSLRPRLLAQSFLPPFGGGLAGAFGSEGYAEFVGYVGIAALMLAFIGLSLLWRRTADGARPQRNIQRSTVLAASGFLLALGAYNPLYYLLWRVVPGFDLFRAPARWLALYALGMAALAGFGLDALTADTAMQGRAGAGARGQGRWIKRGVIVGGALVLAALIIIQQRPPWPALAGWAIAGIAAAGLLRAARRWPRFARGALVALTFVELWLGGRGLPFTLATAPSATSLRNAPAALLAATRDQPPAGRDRFLSLSDIRFDPGDLAELRAGQAGRLSPDAIERLVRAAKQVEVLAPNLPLLYGLPAVDGYDGGLLPLGRYVQLQSLFLPPELLMPDGRLREQLRRVPETRLLDLTGVRFVITDKQRDLWADDVYYDLELGAQLDPGQELNLNLSAYAPFSATALGLVAETAGGVPDGAQLAEVNVTDAGGRSTLLDLRAGPGTSSAATPVRLRLPEPMSPVSITVRVPAGAPAWVLRGLSLIDERTGAHSSVTVSPQDDFRRIHSGDVKIYERAGAPGRAWLVHGIQPVSEDTAALALMDNPAFDSRASVVVSAALDPRPPAPATPGESVEVTDYAPERAAFTANVTSPAVLVLADAFYPGWQATVDGVSAPILRANLMFRGLALEPGRHEIVFTYRPSTWRLGVAISFGALAALAAAVIATGVYKRRNAPHTGTPEPAETNH